MKNKDMKEKLETVLDKISVKYGEGWYKTDDNDIESVKTEIIDECKKAGLNMTVQTMGLHLYILPAPEKGIVIHWT